jgi:hypothetical protein
VEKDLFDLGRNDTFRDQRPVHFFTSWTQLLHLSLSLFFFFKIYLFIICKYTVAVFRCTRRGHQISLQVVVNHHAVAGI